MLPPQEGHRPLSTRAASALAARTMNLETDSPRKPAAFRMALACASAMLMLVVFLIVIQNRIPKVVNYRKCVYILGMKVISRMFWEMLSTRGKCALGLGFRPSPR